MWGSEQIFATDTDAALDALGMALGIERIELPYGDVEAC